MSLLSTLLYALVGVVMYPAPLWLLLKLDNHDFSTVAAKKSLLAFYVITAGMCAAIWPVFVILLFFTGMIWCITKVGGIRAGPS